MFRRPKLIRRLTKYPKLPRPFGSLARLFSVAQLFGKLGMSLLNSLVWAEPSGRPIQFRVPGSLVIIVAATAITSAAAQTPDKAKHQIEGVRNLRYSDIIPFMRHGIRLVR